MLSKAVLMMSLLSIILVTSLHGMFQHPIYLSTFLILQTFLVSMSLIFFCESSWFSLLILIMFIGGTLIIFAYIISLIKNTLMKKEKKIFILVMILLKILVLLYVNKKILITSNELTSFSDLLSMKFIFFLFSCSYFKISVLLIIYLFLTMLVILKLINTKKNNMKF